MVQAGCLYTGDAEHGVMYSQTGLWGCSTCPQERDSFLRVLLDLEFVTSNKIKSDQKQELKYSFRKHRFGEEQFNMHLNCGLVA